MTTIQSSNIFLGVEVESNGMYKSLDDDYILNPFANLDKLCRFLLL
ncbi:hypothetical protein BH11BAC3_BH11BAC3_22470 [soil metagenome]